MSKKKQVIRIDSLIKSMNVVILPEAIGEIKKIMLVTLNNALDNARSN